MKVDTIVGKGMYLFAVQHILKETINKIEPLQWRIINVPTDFVLPTSDDPVICMNYNSHSDYDFKGGWGKKNCNVIFPVTPKHILIAQVGKRTPLIKNENLVEWCEFFRKIIIEHAHRYVFAPIPIKGMFKLRPRIVDPKLFEQEKLMLESWHKIEMARERILLK